MRVRRLVAIGAVCLSARTAAGCGPSGVGGGGRRPPPSSGASAGAAAPDDHGDDYGSATPLGHLPQGPRVLAMTRGQLETLKDADWFTVGLARSHRYRITAATPQDTRLHLLDPHGVIVAEADDVVGFTPVLTYTPTHHGIHYVVVGRGQTALDTISSQPPDRRYVRGFWADAAFDYALSVRTLAGTPP